MLNFDWLMGVSVGAAKWVFLILFILIGLLVFIVPKDFVYEGVENPRWWHNLKIWAIVDLVFIFVVYWIF